MSGVPVLALLVLVGNLVAADPPRQEAPQQAAWLTIDQSLQSGDVDHRRQAIVALATIGGTNHEAVERVVRCLRSDKDPRVRMQAALALGTMQATEAIPALKSALTDTGEVAFAASKSLIDLRDPAGEGMLIAVLAGGRSDTPGIMTKAVREAQNRLRHPTNLMLMGAEDATGAMFGPAAMGFTAAKDAVALKGSGTPGRAAAAAYLAKDPDPYAVTLLEWALGDGNQFVRVEAAKSLGARGNAASIAKLQPLLKDSHTTVRTMAAASIIRLDGM
jgi:HEAT repeat protein